MSPLLRNIPDPQICSASGLESIKETNINNNKKFFLKKE